MVAEEIAPLLFSVDDYVRLGEAGVLRDDRRHELIEGVVYEVPPQGIPHSVAVSRLTETLILQLAGRAIVRPGLPLLIAPRSLPEPDLGIYAHRADHYATGHPSAADLMVAIEIAGSSLRFDSGTKARMYARAAVANYWIVDVNDRALLVHTEPSDRGYGRIHEHRSGTLRLPGTDAVVDLDALFA